MSPDDNLREPLLYGGQGEKYHVKCALVEPQGDVNAGEKPNNNKSSTVPDNGNKMQPPAHGKNTNSPLRSINADRETETLTPESVQCTGSTRAKLKTGPISLRDYSH